MAETKIKKVTKSTTAVGGTTNLQWITKSQAIYDGSTGGGDDTTGGGGEVAEVNGETLEFKASSDGNDIVLNSNEEATQVLTNIKQGNTVYSVPQGGGGSSKDLYYHDLMIMAEFNERVDLSYQMYIRVSLYSYYNEPITKEYFEENYKNIRLEGSGVCYKNEQEVYGLGLYLTTNENGRVRIGLLLKTEWLIVELGIVDIVQFEDTVKKVQ